MNAVLEAREPSARYLAALEPPILSQFDLIAQAPNGVARLRELILTLAVQGKLVPQDPDDEPASALLERIRAEKARLVKEGKIRKEKVLAAIGEEEKQFGLPAGWEWSCLAGIGVISPRNDLADESEASFVQMSSIPVAFMTPHSTEIRLWGDIKSGFTHFADGDVGVAKITPCFENGKSTVFRNLTNGIGAGTTELHIVRPLGQVSPDYVLIFLKTPSFLKEGESGMTGSAGQKRLPRSYFETKPFPLPPLAEQSRIVARVEELMALCDTLEAKGKLEAEQHSRLVGGLFDSLANSESAHALTENWQRIATHFDLLLDRPSAVDALGETILQLAVHGLLVPQDPSDEPASALLQKIRAEKSRLITTGQLKRDKSLPPISDEEKPFELPEGWEWVPVETLAHVGTGTTPSRDNPAFFSAGSIPWVTSGETSQEFIQATAEHVSILALEKTSLTLYPPGTLIVAMYGQGKTRGQVSELLIEATTNQACAAIVLMEPDKDHRAYVKLVFEKSYDEIRELSAGGAQPNLNVGKVKGTLIPLPPLTEQSRIVARVVELRAICAKLRHQLSASQQTLSRLSEALVETATA